jgi:hypothetical protein
VCKPLLVCARPHSQLLQLASAPRLSKGNGGRSARSVTSALLLPLLKGTLPCAAAVQNLLVQEHLATSARLTPDRISSGVGSAAEERGSGTMCAGRECAWRNR